MTLDVPTAIELGDFVSAFTALASEFDRYAREESREGGPAASLYVSEVRQGSIQAILIPMLPLLPQIANTMSQVLAVEDFVGRYGRRLLGLSQRQRPPEDVSKAMLEDFGEQVAAIANNPGSTLELAAIEIENGDHKVRSAFKFDTTQSRTIEETVAVAKRELEHRERADHERVLMVFTRSDVGMAQVGKSTGERVKVEAISDRPLPLIYASAMAEERIKYEITEAAENVYKKGFVVDVNLESRGGKPAAYRVTAVHQVIDLDED